MTVSNKKILIVAPSWIGDMVMAQSLLKFLHQQHPNCLIDVIAPPSTFPLLQFMPQIQHRFCVPFKRSNLDLWQRLKHGWMLRQNHYDQAIVLPNSWKSAILPFVADIKQRTGWHGEMRYGLLNDRRRLNKKLLPLMVQRFLALGDSNDIKKTRSLSTVSSLASADLLPQLEVTPADQQSIITKLQLEPQRQPILSLCPGAVYGPSKRWIPDYFAEVARIKNSQGYQIYLLGSSADQLTAEHIQQASNHCCVNLTGKTNLEEVIAILSLSQVAIGNDSGLMHAACALSVPVVALFGPLPSELAPPLNLKAKALDLKIECSPCFQRECPLGHHRCMRDLKPAMVIKALEELMI